MLEKPEPGEDLARQFNELYPVGTPVVYWPVLGHPHCIKTLTRSRAWALSSGTPVVKVEGFAGGVAISHLIADTEA